jgi:hypothetical protein
MLNISVAPKFQAKGFALNPKTPVILLPPDIISEVVQAAVDAGILIDITDAGIKTLKIKGSELSAVQNEETKKMDFFTGIDASGNRYFITPKDEADRERMLAEIAATGGLRIPKEKAEESGASFAVFSEPIPQLDTYYPNISPLPIES